MKWVSTLILLVAALVLFAFVFFWERKQPTSEEAAAREKRLFTFEEKDVRWIELDHDGTAVRFERAAGTKAAAPAVASPLPSASAHPAGDADASSGWRMVRPLQDRADDDLVNGLARKIAELAAIRTFDAGSRVPSDADAGLQPPRFRISFDAGAGPRTLTAGRDAPATSGVFLRSPDGKTCLVPRGLVEGLDRPADEWRDHSLFDFGAVDLSAAELIRPAGPLRFRREGEDWRLTAPVEDEAAGSKIQALLSSITAVRAETFHTEQEVAGKTALQPPVRQARLTRRDGTVVELAIGGPVEGTTDRVYARIPSRPGVAEIASRILQDLDTAPDACRSRKLFGFSPWDVRSITIQSKGTTIELNREGETSGAAPPKWTAVRPPGLTPKPEAVESLLNDLLDLEASEIAGPAGDLAAWGLDSPTASVAITASTEGAGPQPAGKAAATETAPRTQLVRFGKTAPGEGRIYAQREGRPWVLIVPARTVDTLDVSSLK